MGKKIIDAKNDKKGNVEAVRFSGNKSFTPVKQAIQMAKRGEIDNAIAVDPKNAKEHLRTKPDNRRGNNLDEMAKH